MNRIKYYREKNIFSQADIAERIGGSQQAVSKWETGKSMPRADKLSLLAKLLNCSIDDLFKSNT